MIFKCVNCKFSNNEFPGNVIGSSQGAFTYQAKCPKCGSHMVVIESDLAAAITDDTLYLKIVK